MPRTFKATIVLIVCISLLAVLTIISVVQANRTEKTTLRLSQKLEAIEKSQGELRELIGKGVTVRGSSSAAGQDDGCAQALKDPRNLIKAPIRGVALPDAKVGGTLRRSMSSDPKGFNWITENSSDVNAISEHVVNTIAHPDRTDPTQWQAGVACKVTVNDDFTEYTIHLRQGVYWQVPAVDLSDPQFAWLKQARELTSADAAYYFELVTDPKVEAGAIKSYYGDLAGVDIVDRYTLRVRWKRKVFQSKSYTLWTRPMPKWLFTRSESGEAFPKEIQGLKFNNHWASQYPIGTGPYQITKIEKGVRVLLERNSRYFGPKPPVERIEYQLVRDPNQELLKLRGGEIDLIERMQPKDYEREILNATTGPFKNGELKHDVVPRLAYYYIGWNADKPIFKDKRVRRAMTHALDRQGIVDNVLKGLGEIHTGHYPPGHPGIEPSIKPYAFDLAQARALLDQAGWRDSDGDGIRDKTVDGRKIDFKFNLLSYNRPSALEYISIFKESLRKIGVIMNPQPADWALLQKQSDERKFDALTGGWGLVFEQDPHQIWHSSNADVPKGSNRVGFRNKEADKIIDELRLTFDPEKRVQLLRSFHRVLHEEQPYTFFYSSKMVPAWNKRVRNVSFAANRPQVLTLDWSLE